MNQELQEKLNRSKCPTHGEMFTNDCDTCFCALSLCRDAFAHAYAALRKELDLNAAEALRNFAVAVSVGEKMKFYEFKNAKMEADPEAGFVRFVEYPLQTETLFTLRCVVEIRSERQ